MRKWFQKLFALILRLYFRRVEVYGEERIPKDGPIIFVLNHPNALVDPLFILCLSPRDVSFLAKEPLFRMPIVGFFVRLFDSIPVYRKKDGADTSKNKKMFAQCREMLNQGKALALFPEGVSHNAPKLMPLKTGTARIALGAASQQTEGQPLKIVPAGLYFTEKFTYRSKALLYYGPPVEVNVVQLDENDEPPRDAVIELTETLKEALAGIVLEAQHEEALSMIQRAEKIFSGGRSEESDLASELEVRQRFARAYEQLQKSEPARLFALQKRMERYEAELDGFGVAVENLNPDFFTTAKVLRYVSKRLLFLPVVLPLSLIGTILHYPSYRLVGTLAKRVAKRDDDVLSTVKILGSLIFFPLVWILVAGALWSQYSLQVGLLALVVTPITAWVANSFWEHLDDLKLRTRAFGLFLTRRKIFDDLLREQENIREEMFALGQLVEDSAPSS